MRLSHKVAEPLAVTPNGARHASPGSSGDWQLADSHCHLDAAEFASEPLTAILARAQASRVHQLLTVGLDLPSSRAAVQIAQGHAAVWAAIGVAPNDLDGFDRETVAALAELARDERVVAIGEIGLDYHWRPETRDRQREAFEAQLALAAQLKLPVVIHSREADSDMRPILLEWAAGRPLAQPPYGMLHCFSGGPELAQEYAAHGFLISLSGVVTFPRAHLAKAVASSLELDHLLLETDAPYLAPQAHRGRRNEPAFLLESAQQVAQLRGISVAQVANATFANFARLLRLPLVTPEARERPGKETG